MCATCLEKRSSCRFLLRGRVYRCLLREGEVTTEFLPETHVPCLSDAAVLLSLCLPELSTEPPHPFFVLASWSRNHAASKVLCQLGGEMGNTKTRPSGAPMVCSMPPDKTSRTAATAMTCLSLPRRANLAELLLLLKVLRTVHFWRCVDFVEPCRLSKKPGHRKDFDVGSSREIST